MDFPTDSPRAATIALDLSTHPTTAVDLSIDLPTTVMAFQYVDSFQTISASTTLLTTMGGSPELETDKINQEGNQRSP